MPLFACSHLLMSFEPMVVDLAERVASAIRARLWAEDDVPSVSKRDTLNS